MARKPTFEEGRAFERAAFLQEIALMKERLIEAQMHELAMLNVMERWVLDRTAEAQAGMVARAVEGMRG
jgi:hypothetical protein